ncbi:MAG: Crp/Fnr family transcriptional regulator [Crocinitomicaceae bacterium]
MFSKTEFTQKYPILNDEKLVDQILKVAKIQKIAAQEILVDIGQEITHFPLIVDGSLKIQREDADGREVFLYYVESGNTCAATVTCCLKSKRSNIRATVEEDSKILNIPINYMDEWICMYPVWRAYIFQSFSNRFDDLLNAVDQLAFKKMDERLLEYLKNTASLIKGSTVHMSHQEIAIDLNTSREVISRLLKQLELAELVQLGRGKIEIL